jgi:putative PIN family toxin of toxin-antitoxin system
VTSAVLDSNVLLSGFLGERSVTGHLLLGWLVGDFELVISEEIFAEVARNLVRPYFRRRLTLPQIAQDLTLLATEARLTPITTSLHGIASHPEDDRILETAVSAQVDYLVTGDRQLRRIGTYQGVQIVSPREFLDVLSQLPT